MDLLTSTGRFDHSQFVTFVFDNIDVSHRAS